jgi:hypothetical protein
MGRCHFRIPDQFDSNRGSESIYYENILKHICLMVDSIIVPTEKETNITKFYGQSQITRCNDDLNKFMIGYSNDWFITLIDPKENIYGISYRYDTETNKNMRQTTAGICAILNLDYIYNLNFETKLRNNIRSLPHHFSKNEFYKWTREEITSIMQNLRLFEKDLLNEEIQDAIISNT